MVKMGLFLIMVKLTIVVLLLKGFYLISLFLKLIFPIKQILYKVSTQLVQNKFCKLIWETLKGEYKCLFLFIIYIIGGTYNPFN